MIYSKLIDGWTGSRANASIGSGGSTVGTVVRVRGIKRFRDRHGKWRTYHRKSGKPIKAEFGTAAFFDELSRLDDMHRNTVPKAGTLGRLFAEWRGSADALALSHRTRQIYDAALDYLKPLDAMPLTELDRAFVVKLRDRAFAARKRFFATSLIYRLSSICAWAVDRDLIDNNPCRGVRPIKRPRDLPRANRPWTPAELAVVLDAAPPHVRLPLALCAYAGLRGGDALSLPKSAFDGTSIGVRTRKTGQEVWWPCPAPLLDIIKSAPQHDAPTLAATSRGQPWTAGGFRCVVFDLLRKLRDDGKVGAGLTVHGLRTTAAVMLRELGYDERTIADALGQSSPGVAMHYARGADLRIKMQGVVDALDARGAVKPEQKSVKPRKARTKKSVRSNTSKKRKPPNNHERHVA